MPSTNGLTRTASPSATAQTVEWVTASPLWDTASKQPQTMWPPALLRFESDAFMDELIALVQSGERAALSRHLAKPASYQARPLGAPATWKPPAQSLKLYQPAHGHFYIVAASLICSTVGLPERVVDTTQAEQVAFVMRRLDAAGNEWAWVKNAAAGKGWVRAPKDTVAEHEELLPLAPISFEEESRRRRVWVGLIPTSSRETFQAGTELTLAPDTPQPDPREDEVYSRVIQALKEQKATSTVRLSPQQRAEASRFILLDLADFLAINTPALWKRIESAGAVLGAPTRLEKMLDTYKVDNSGLIWTRALLNAWALRHKIVAGDDAAKALHLDLRETNLNADDLYAELKSALKTFGAPAPPAATTAALPIPKFDPRADARYVVRCVYRRPHCGSLRPDVVSLPSESFAIASFFDFDAPSRPIRISLPVDTSPGGLRKFNKNVAFLISDKLKAQMESVVDFKKALDGDVTDKSPNLGVICSFSIPIITICALILLMLIINLLNIVFWWLPFFRICFPIGLKSKQV